MQEDILIALNEIEDPELHIGIVDLGLIYRADWSEKGIEVEFTTTSPSCPFAEMLVKQVKDILSRHFGEAASIHSRLVHEPPWTPERITEIACQRLGWTRRPNASPATSASAFSRARPIWKN
jgi:metal-sulfur cluster biosynthetic enzyme